MPEIPSPAGRQVAAGAPDKPEAAPDVTTIRRWSGRTDLCIESVDCTGSTQLDLTTRARERAFPGPLLRLARRQEAGRGRMGRVWQGDDGGSLLFSLGMPWSLAAASTAGVTLACGLALARHLETLLAPHGARIELKWPNDLLLGGAKLAGILVEIVRDGDARATLVVGVGCNLALAPEVRAAIDRQVADLAEVLGAAAARGLRERLAGELAGALLDACQEFAREGLRSMRDDYVSRLAWRGERVRLVDEGREPRSGHLLGIDESGRLLLGSRDGIEAVSGGELRREAQA